MDYKKFIKTGLYVIIAILIALIIFLLNSLIIQYNYEWAQSLNQPICKPAAVTFYIVWAGLFVLIASSAIMILGHKVTTKKLKKYKNIAIGLFLLNALLNGMFTVLFYGARNIVLAFAELPILIAAILILIWVNYKLYRPAAYLLVPYLIWILYATILVGIVLFIN